MSDTTSADDRWTDRAATRMRVSFTGSGVMTFTFHQAPVQSEERP
ncbi:hypothetical protein [Nocardia sp. BMG51109]|nr:hypothetical protein [Nocardia sp. BMG51109]